MSKRLLTPFQMTKPGPSVRPAAWDRRPQHWPCPRPGRPLGRRTAPGHVEAGEGGHREGVRSGQDHVALPSRPGLSLNAGDGAADTHTSWAPPRCRGRFRPPTAREAVFASLGKMARPRPSGNPRYPFSPPGGPPSPMTRYLPRPAPGTPAGSHPAEPGLILCEGGTDHARERR